MDRKRTVLAASGLSTVLIVGSTAFAFANGIFVTKPVDRVGSFQAIQARLVPQTKPGSNASPAGAPPPGPSSRRTAPTSSGGATQGAVVPPGRAAGVTSTPEPDVRPNAEPKVEPDTRRGDVDSIPTAHVTSSTRPYVTSTTAPTGVPVIRPATTTTIADSAPSTVPGEPGDDGLPGGPHSDD